MMRLIIPVVAMGLLLQAPFATPIFEDMGIAESVIETLIPVLGAPGTASDLFVKGKIALAITKFVNIISDQVLGVSLEDLHTGTYFRKADRKILAMFELLSQRLDQMEGEVDGIATSLEDLGEGMQETIRWEIALDTMKEYMRPINSLHKRFLLYQQLKDKIEDQTLLDFANQVISHETHSVMSLMALLHSLAVPEASLRSESPPQDPSDSFASLNDHKDAYLMTDNMTQKLEKKEKMKYQREGQFLFRPSLFQMLQQVLKSSDRCNVKQSPQQLVNGLRVLIDLTEAKGYAMLQFAWMILNVYNKGNFTVEREVAQRLYLHYTEDLLTEARKVLVNESREFYRCDPKEYIGGETHIQFTELLQGYIENEVDMSSDHTCKRNCAYYQHTKSEGCYSPLRQLCGKQRRCRGTLHDCKFHKPDALVCLSRNPHRQYDYVKYESGLRLGLQDTCDGTTMQVDSWYRWFVHCSYCLCLCDDDSSPTTDRFISLMPASSDTHNNMVVTGVKFTKQQRVIHVKIQQGQALPQGLVNKSSIHWVDVDPVNIMSSTYQEGTHFKKLSYEDRNIDLDRLTAPADHVVTGIKFRMLGAHINLEVQVTPVNFTSGELQPLKSYWISNDNTPAMSKNERKQFQISDSDDPTKFSMMHTQDSVPDTYIRFGPTSREADVSQLTIPFFDAQEVSPSPSSWLSGVELFHKGQEGSGGFLTLKVLTYDLTQHMELIKNERRLESLFKPITDNIDSNLEDIVNENKEGLGMLDYMKIISDKLLYFALETLNLKAKSSLIDHHIVTAFQHLSQHLDLLEYKAHTVKSSLQRLADKLRDVLRWEIDLNTMEEYTRAINTQYDRLILYEGLKNKVENQTFLEFVKQIVSHDSYSISSLMGNLHSMAAPDPMKSSLDLSDDNISKNRNPELEIVKWTINKRETKRFTKRDVNQDLSTFKSSLFRSLHDAIQLTDPCTLDQSPQQLMKGLYLLLAITQARGFVMLEFAWMVLRVYNEGNFTTEQEMSEHLYMKYSKDILNEAQKVMAEESRDFYRCDPAEHIEAKTYVQFTEFLQGYMENEVNMNSGGSCQQNCAYYQHAIQEQCFQPYQQLCGKQRRCPGVLRDCKFYDADSWVCLSENPHRRYDYIRYESGLQLGSDGVCNGTVEKVDSWYRMIYHCSYCLCLCDDDDSTTSDRYISLTPVLSDAENNMVVTGVKFTKVNRVIHVMIQQGQALPKGGVNASTIHWVDVKPININSLRYVEGVDYKKLSYAERTIDLDRLEGPAGLVVTGIGFRMLGYHINLQIKVTPVDYATGKLQPTLGYWVSNNNMPKLPKYPRREIQLLEPGDPSKISTPSREHSTPNSYLLFGPSSRTLDVAQLTVPFFDAQEVSPSSVTWLSGIDLYHKGQSGSGGFLSLKVITYDLSLIS